MDISSKIKAIREAKKIKQIDIANTLDLDPSYYFRLEKRGDKLTLEQLEKIAGALDVSVKELLFGEKQVNNNEERVKELEEENKQLNEWLYNSADKETKTQFLIEEAFRYFLRQYEVALNVEDSPLSAYYQLHISYMVELPHTSFFRDFVEVNRTFLISFISINSLYGEFEDVVRLMYEEMKPYSLEEKYLLKEYEMQLKVNNKRNAFNKPKE
ncbi:helix-turn-helix domain-containing protein [Runella sp.]|uniref:helix-turn-helix domain-containing protein n=1 Tax=Runella sp. TaxID=1960881 RepID=UPI0026175FCC|nr:helix-turn-helix domain-containing protein [Runella sp.]